MLHLKVREHIRIWVLFETYVCRTADAVFKVQSRTLTLILLM
jgi:hypothetical protein